jgi:acyl-CoA thioesterase I
LFKLITTPVLIACLVGFDATGRIDVTSHVKQTPVQSPSTTVEHLREGQNQKIVCYGTSLTAGGAWVNQLAEALDSEYPKLATVINSGQGAMWSKWGVENVVERVVKLDPDLVLIEFSINDAYLEYDTSVTQAQKNLEVIISTIRTNNSDTEIVLMIMNPPLGIHLKRRPNITNYEAMYRKLASSLNLRLIDCSRSWQSLIAQKPRIWQQLVPDDIHPNELGCASMVTPCVLRGLGIQPTNTDGTTGQ